MAQIEQAALAAHATPASTAALPPDAQLSGLTIPDHPNTTTTSAALPAMTSPAPTTSLAARALTAHAPQEPSEAHRTDLLAEPEVITALPESPRPAPTAAPAAEHTAQSLITLPPPPLFTAQQLHLAASGLEYLALPLLNYLDPEARYCLIDSLQGSAKFQHLALQAVTLPAKRDYIALRSKQYAQQQAQQQAQPSARIPLRDNERKELARWARVPLPLNRPDTALAFSATPLEAQLDYSVLTPAWYNPPQSVPEQLALPQGQLEVQLGSERLRLDPDCNFLLDVLGLLLQQTGFCTIPIFRPGQTRSAKTAYQCLDAACRKPQSLYALFFLSEGGLSLEQSKSRLYAPLYSAALDTSASALSHALKLRSSERAFLNCKITGAYPVTPPHRATPTKTAPHLAPPRAAPYAAARTPYYPLEHGVPQALIARCADWPQHYRELSAQHSAPSFNPRLFLGTTAAPWQRHEQMDEFSHRAAEPQRKLVLRSERNEVVCAYLNRGLGRLCLNSAPTALRSSIEHSQTWEVLVDGTAVLCTYWHKHRTNQRLLRTEPNLNLPHPPFVTPLGTLTNIELLRQPHTINGCQPAMLCGGCYWGHEVKLYAFPSLLAPQAHARDYELLSLVSPWEVQRVAAFWRYQKQHQATLSCPSLFPHSGTTWFNQTKQLSAQPTAAGHAASAGRAASAGGVPLSYDGSEASRQILTGANARHYCLEQNLVYGATRERNLAELLATPESTLRHYISEDIRSHALKIAPELLSASATSHQLLNFAQLKLKVLLQNGLSCLQAHYYSGSALKYSYQLAATMAPPQRQPDPVPRLRSVRASKKPEPPRSRRAPIAPAVPVAPAEPIEPRLTAPETLLYLTALVRHYYEELQLQGLLYAEHVRLPLLSAAQWQLPAALLRLVIAATAARPDLHFCYAQLGQPFTLTPKLESSAGQRPSLSNFDPPRTRTKRALRRTIMPSIDLRPELSAEQYERCESAQHLCDLTLYFTEPNWDSTRAQRLQPYLEAYAQRHHLKAPRCQSSHHARKLASYHNLLQPLPLWTHEQLAHCDSSANCAHALTFVQYHVLKELSSAHALALAPRNRDFLSHPHLHQPQSYRLSPSAHYLGQVNFFLAAAVYGSTKELTALPSHTSTAQGSPHFPTLRQFLYTLEALEHQEALFMQCRCGHSSVLFNPELVSGPRGAAPSLTCPFCQKLLCPERP